MGFDQNGRFYMTPGARKSVVILGIIVLVFAAANAVLSTREYNANKSQQAVILHRAQTECAFLADIGTAPVPTKANGSSTPSKLGITIITDARNSWYGLACPGHISPPSKTLMFWAAHYKLDLR